MGDVVQRADEATRYVYAFEEGSRDDKFLLGGKGANLAEMTRLGLRVPPGFVVSTEACRAYLAAGNQLPQGLMDEVLDRLTTLEERMGRRLGDPEDPLLVSVRSGAPFSMPGMMDTVLNLGLNDESVQGLVRRTGDERFAWDAYRRFIQLFGKVVLGVPGDAYEALLQQELSTRAARDETDLDADVFRLLVDEFKALTSAHTGQPFPQDPQTQLQLAIAAVFRSWNGRRARDYRRMEGISDDLGTAVNVQVMVFGNYSTDSGTGVAFTRDPASGLAVPYGDWLTAAQGEDVVAGIRVTEHLDDLARRYPGCHKELLDVLATLERHYTDMCDVEFTIERGTLWILQTRVGKRTARAALRMAVDMVAEGLIDEQEAVRRISPAQLEQLLHPQFAPDSEHKPIAVGLNASPGAAVGEVCFTADDAEARAARGVDVILVRPETSPDDLHGMIAARGIVTSRGGLVSHAAVVARGMGKPAICGADDLHIDVARRRIIVGSVEVHEGDIISMDGTSGEVVLGEVALVVPDPSGPLETLLVWADSIRRLGIRANADTPEDVARAMAFGAEGIGLCRTEHMFLGERLVLVQRVILAETEAEEQAALDDLLQVQRGDFDAILRAVGGKPLTVRLLDPPLHEFLPDIDDLLVRRALGHLEPGEDRLLDAALDWREANPMLGIRGCRLGVLKPGLYRMQVRALTEAALAVQADGLPVDIEIMVPLVVLASELSLIAGWIRETVDDTVTRAGGTLSFRLGTMIETPRAALVAGEVARHAEFFSFGTNDLTQTVYGFSRDDVEGRLMPAYRQHGVLELDPFATLDPDGVGRLIDMAVTSGRAANPRLETGICGEHGGDPASIALCDRLGLDYVSCSPFRLPIARLTAAQSVLGGEGLRASA